MGLCYEQYTRLHELDLSASYVTLSTLTVATEAVGLVNTPADVLLLITVWWITFTVVVTLVLCLGFGPSGIVAGEWVGFYGSFNNG